MARDIQLRLGCQSYFWDCCVAPISDDLILGLDFLHAQGAVVDLPHACLSLRQVTVPIKLVANGSSPSISTEFVLCRTAVIPPFSMLRVPCVGPVLPKADSLVALELTNLLSDYGDVFAISDTDLGRFDRIKHGIDTGGTSPIKQRMRRTPLGFAEEEDKYLDSMLKHGIIRPSFSDWASSPVLVLGRFRDFNLKLKPRKCHLLQQRVPFLGRVVSRNGIEMDPGKVSRVVWSPNLRGVFFSFPLCWSEASVLQDGVNVLYEGEDCGGKQVRDPWRHHRPRQELHHWTETRKQQTTTEDRSRSISRYSCDSSLTSQVRQLLPLRQSANTERSEGQRAISEYWRSEVRREQRTGEQAHPSLSDSKYLEGTDLLHFLLETQAASHPWF
ncbi:hypothetical protein CAPTEDRAFT_202802 [Capitella teleta]|uniref:Peptidase A2 domain-containing protein n=1 Tax=Capitella teleta TaxID=283909 RepID=R7USR7_CAPTE|nr:hypothetical protein CAPTEDRAFT_202802 [Capitella teleta]|eukprot:ELU09188.1 hypothetical protein CAPTEDRAFT_202802 [Capitella teleta]